jgi:2'-5' RNA ligase
LNKKEKLFIAASFDEKSSEKINQLRLSLGVKNIGRLKPHITLVPPFLIDETSQTLKIFNDLTKKFELPITVTLGPAESFSKKSAVLYLKVSKSLNLDLIYADLQNAFNLIAQFDKKFIAHVTLARIRNHKNKEQALKDLCDICFDAKITSIDLMRYDFKEQMWHEFI